MFCRNCGKEVNADAATCPSCGANPKTEKKFCPGCGAATTPEETACSKCGASLTAGAAAAGEKSKMVAGLLGIFIGSLGIHKFYMGYKKEGLIMLLVTLLTCGTGGGIMCVIGLIEGIMYLTKSDEEFEQIYVKNQKGWF